MENDFNYSIFVDFIKDLFKDSESLNVFQTLIEYFEEYPPSDLESDPDSDFAKEEIERRVREILPLVSRDLKSNESEWLEVQDGKLKERTTPEEKITLAGYEAYLNDEQLKLVKLNYDQLDKDKRSSILSIYENISVVHGTVDENFKILEKIYNSYKYLEETDVNYIKLLGLIANFCENNKGKNFHKNAYEYYEDASQYYRKRYEHEKSANEYSSAVKALSSVLADSSLELSDEEKKFYRNTSLRLTRAMRIQYELAGDEDSAVAVFNEENKLKRELAGKKAKSWMHIISDNCQNPVKVAWCALALIILATIIFSVSGLTQDGTEQSFTSGNEAWYYVLWDSFYFSIVTFTTLGYGDFSPGEGISRLFANAVSVLGLLLSSLFLVTLVKKYGR